MALQIKLQISLQVMLIKEFARFAKSIVGWQALEIQGFIWHAETILHFAILTIFGKLKNWICILNIWNQTQKLG